MALQADVVVDIGVDRGELLPLKRNRSGQGIAEKRAELALSG
jgi:hypothetical protein